MATLSIEIDERTAERILDISAIGGELPSETAARLLRRAVRDARPRLQYDRAALRAFIASAADEEIADAEAGLAERAELLEGEDRA